MSIVRENLMKDVNYRPYCGNGYNSGCFCPRTEYRSIDGQFICPECKWISYFEPEFIAEYKTKHNLK